MSQCLFFPTESSIGPSTIHQLFQREDFCDDTEGIAQRAEAAAASAAAGGVVSPPVGSSDSSDSSSSSSSGGGGGVEGVVARCGTGTEAKPKGFNRLLPGGRVRLRYAYVVTCDEVVRDPKTGEALELRGEWCSALQWSG